MEDCIRSILQQTIQPTKIILVADRCTDRTVEIATSILPMERSAILRKESASWHNSYSENLELARQQAVGDTFRSEEHTSELQSHSDLVCRLLLEKKNKTK